MPLTLPAPPHVEGDLWDDPEVVAAVEAGDVARFLLAVRGARRARWSQDKLAKMIGCHQATVSELECGRRAVTPQRLDAILTGLAVPTDLRRRWGG